MTNPLIDPEWSSEIPSAPVHKGQSQGGLTRPFSAQQLVEFGIELIEQFLRRVVNAVVGFFIPGGGPAFDQLANWADGINDGLQNFATLVTGIDFNQTPAQVWHDIMQVFIRPLSVFAELIGGFISSLQIPTLDPTKILNLPGLFSDFGNTIEGFFQALTGQTGATSYVDPVEALTYLADQVSGSAQAIAELQAANAGSENSGLSGGDNFQIPYTGSLGPGWSLTSTNGITTYVDTSTGKAEWHNSGNATPTVTARRINPADAKTLTEFQKITVTLTTPTGQTFGRIRLQGRTSDNGLHYVVAYASPGGVSIAYAAGGAEIVVDSGPLPGDMKLTTGTVISLECGTAEGQNEYDVKLNGVNAQSYTDTGGLITTSLNYAARGLSEAPKGWALGWAAALELGQWRRPPSLSGCTIADNIPAEIKGHGFRVYRESTTGEELTLDEILCPHYDEIDYITPGSAWSAAGYVVPKAGMWSFSHRFIRTAANWTYVVVGLHVNGAIRAAGGIHSGVNIAQDTFLMYCEEGDVVDLRINQKSGTVAMVGSSTGADSYFAGALMSS